MVQCAAFVGMFFVFGAIQFFNKRLEAKGWSVRQKGKAQIMFLVVIAAILTVLSRVALSS